MNEEIMTIKELAIDLRGAEKTIYRLVASNKLPGFKDRGSWRFRKAETDQWITSQQASIVD